MSIDAYAGWECRSVTTLHVGPTKFPPQRNIVPNAGANVAAPAAGADTAVIAVAVAKLCPCPACQSCGICGATTPRASCRWERTTLRLCVRCGFPLFDVLP